MNQLLEQDIQNGRVDIILTSPEMILRNRRFQELIGNAKFARHIKRVYVDECHCISQWGESFRPSYAQVGDIRAFLPSKVPFIAMSATLPPEILTDVKRTLHMGESTLLIKLGNDRPNIRHEIACMTGSKENPTDILDLLPSNIQPGTKLEKTVWFCNSRDACHATEKILREALPKDMQNQVAVFHSLRSKRARRRIMQQFEREDSRIRILICTEAAGMVSSLFVESLYRVALIYVLSGV